MNHNEIREWIKLRGGRPALVPNTISDDGTGLLRIDFGEDDSEPEEEANLEDFFNTFGKKRLTFLYRDTTADGSESRYFKLVSQ